MPTRSAALTVLALAALACAPRRIPGTEIRETADTRAIFDSVRTYGQAMQEEDVKGVLALVAPDYFDTSGTPDPVDDMDAARLADAIRSDFDHVEGLRLELTIRDIRVEGDRGFAEVFYDAWYRVQTPQGTIPRRDSDLHRISFRRVQKGDWKIVSGL
jgi:ketosteroid isomerase-like protein